MTRRHANEDSGLAAEKATLRAAMRAARAGIPTTERARLAATACTRTLALPELQAAHTVAVYCARGTELALDALVRALGERDDVRLVAPVTLTGRKLAFVPVDATELLADGKGKPTTGNGLSASSVKLPATAEGPADVSEPSEPAEELASRADGKRPAFLAHPERPLAAMPAGRATVAPEAIDVMLIPGLAFDERGMRLGYGAGYYDTWLAKVPDGTAPGKRPLLIGICFDEQLVPRVPAEPHDHPVGLVVTPTRTLRHTQSHKQ